jgi:hypothetical protein
VSPVRYKLGVYIPGDDAIFHSHRRDNLKSYMVLVLSSMIEVRSF